MADLQAHLQAAGGDVDRIEEGLGEGMSRLCLATEASLHRQVVIKLPRSDFASEVSAVRFKHEIELATHGRGSVPNAGEWHNIVFNDRRSAH